MNEMNKMENAIFAILFAIWRFCGFSLSKSLSPPPPAAKTGTSFKTRIAKKKVEPKCGKNESCLR